MNSLLTVRVSKNISYCLLFFFMILTFSCATTNSIKNPNDIVPSDFSEQTRLEQIVESEERDFYYVGKKKISYKELPAYMRAMGFNYPKNSPGYYYRDFPIAILSTLCGLGSVLMIPRLYTNGDNLTNVSMLIGFSTASFFGFNYLFESERDDVRSQVKIFNNFIGSKNMRPEGRTSQ